MSTITLERTKARKLLNTEEINKIFKETKIAREWSFEGTLPSETSKLSHCYHRYPAKFIPQLVEKLMDEYLIGMGPFHVNDLFMGSGTTLACAISRGYFSSGTDINFSSELITRAKCTPIDPVKLNDRIDKFFNDLSFLFGETLFNNKKFKPVIPEGKIERIRYWFNDSDIEELGIILARIKLEKDKNIRIFMLCCFSHILKTTSRWLMGSTKPTIDKKKRPMKPIKAFERHLKKMLRGNEMFWNAVPSETKRNIDRYLNIKRQDAREQPVNSSSVDIQITSSPYVTSYEYADLHQLTTIWLEPAINLNEYKKTFIGTSAGTNGGRVLKSKIGQNIVNKMRLKSNKMADEIEAFFIDMQECFDETYRILKNGGRCCYVIGNTKLKGVDILNAEVFVESMQYANLSLDKIIKREIPSKILPQKRDEKTGRFASNGNGNSHAYPTEYILIMRKT